MSFPNTIRSGFANAFNFSGRATRLEYWYFTLFVMTCDIIFESAGFGVPAGAAKRVILLCSAFGFLLLAIPHLAVGIRRLHDVNRTGWWMGVMLVLGFAAHRLSEMPPAAFGALVPVKISAGIVLSIVVAGLTLTNFVWLVSAGTELNRFGPRPEGLPSPDASAQTPAAS